MINSRKILMVAIFAAAGVIAFLYFSRSDTVIIKKNFARLAETLSKEGRENDLRSAARAGRVADMLAETCRINIPAYDVSRKISKDNVQSTIIMLRARYRSIEVDFHDVTIDFPIAGKAEVKATAFLKAITDNGEKRQEIQELLFFWEKNDADDWLIRQIEAVQVLER